MGFFEGSEWQLGGRLKSVLIVMLSAMLVFAYAAMSGKRPDNGQAAGNAGVIDAYPDIGGNPVDRYFLEIEQRLPENMRNRWQQLYLDAWEQELAHAYELMAQELPETFFAEGGYGLRARQSFGEFVEAQGYLEGYYADGIPGERETVADARLELARAQALRLYQQICEKRAGEEMADLYLFSR